MDHLPCPLLRPLDAVVGLWFYETILHFFAQVGILNGPKWISAVPYFSFFFQKMTVVFLYLISHTQYLNSTSIFTILFDLSKGLEETAMHKHYEIRQNKYNQSINL